MNKRIKFYLQVAVVFMLILLLLLIARHYFDFFNQGDPWIGATGGAAGFAFLKSINNKDNGKKYSN